MDSETTDIASLDRALAYQVQRTARLLRQHLAVVLRAEGAEVSPEQFTILYRIVTEPGCKQADLADRVLVDRPNISRHIDALVNRGLVDRDADTADRRRHSLRVTVRGQRIFESLAPAIIRERNVLYAGVAGDELERFLGVLDALTERATLRISSLKAPQ